MSQALAILCTCPDEASAARLAQGLVAERLAACVNILGPIRSIYRWQDSVEDEAECLMVIKTGHGEFDAVERWLREQHPYDVPEVLALPAERVSGPYLEWLAASVSIEREL
jgi:periplasmic divalent cation tolerance protein